MGVCQAKPQKKKEIDPKLNRNLNSTLEPILNQRNMPQSVNCSRRQSTQRQFKKSGTCNFFDIDKQPTVIRNAKKNQQKNAQHLPQLKIKVNDSIASKDYSVYMGKTKLKNRVDCRVMQHNNDGKLVLLHSIPYNQDGKDYINWLQKTNLDFYMISKIYEIFITGNQIQIITEYCDGGTLSELLHFNLSEQVICNLLEQMLEILQFLHKNKLSHNQLTIDSFSFYYDLQNYLVKLTDLQSLHEIQAEETLNTILYSSPEFLTQRNSHKSNDIWSVAVIAYQLLSKKIIYSDYGSLNNIAEVKGAIVKWIVKQGLNYELSNDFGCLLLSMLKVNRAERFSAEDCLNHTFIVKNYQSNLKCVFHYPFSPNLEGLLKWFLKYFIENYELQHKDAVYRIFSVLDRNKDGKLNELEITDFQIRIQEQVHQQINIETLDKYIANKQEISFEDFMLMVCNKSKYFTTQHIQHSFKKLSNKNDEITIKTLSRVLNIDEEQIIKEFINHNLQYEQSFLSIEYDLYEQMMNQFLVVSKEQ